MKSSRFIPKCAQVPERYSRRLFANAAIAPSHAAALPCLVCGPDGGHSC